MQRTSLKIVSWLGVVGLVVALMAVPSAAAQGKKAAEPAAKVDINSATQKDLEELPGVGEATAKKIIAGRPYASVDDLAKAGVPKNTIAKIAPLVVVGAVPAAKHAPTPSTPMAKHAPATTTPMAKHAPATTATSGASPAPPPAYTPPPAAGMVWVNLETKIYHKEGDRWYGKTKSGKYMTEADAIKAGYRASK